MTSFTNEAKNSTSFSNEVKNSTAFTNERGTKRIKARYGKARYGKARYGKGETEETTQWTQETKN